MGNLVFAYEADIIPLTSVTAVSEAAATPVSNIETRTRPYRVYRGTGAIASETIVIDFGATQNVSVILLDNINASVLSIQGNATDSWGAPSFTQDFIPAYSYPSGRSKVVCVPGATFQYRYLRIYTGAATTTDGTSTLSIGAMTAFDAISTWTENTGYPYRERSQQAYTATVLPGGSVDVTTLGGRYAEITLASALNSSAIDADMRQLLDNAAGGKLVFFYRNNSDLEEGYLCRKLIDTDFEISSAVTRNFTPLVLREVA